MKTKAIIIIITLFLTNILSIFVATAQGPPIFKPGAESLPLSQGWDDYTDPLTNGKVIYNTPLGKNNFIVTVIVDGALPNQKYTPALDLFYIALSPGDISPTPTVFLIDEALSPDDYPPAVVVWTSVTVSREGHTFSGSVTVILLGTFTTDADGHGEFHINMNIKPGSYLGQFWLKHDTGVGPVYFRTGLHFLDVALIEIPQV
ncbi:MAG: hypothetical protein CW716_00005 [Candidatus Bathyarchaeum sp.]|nr:MAG: hypothetical protein CW716_00005 [Candidatus Bathyarchaeum sp.]